MKKLADFLNSTPWMVGMWIACMANCLVNAFLFGETKEPKYLCMAAMMAAGVLWYSYKIDLKESPDE